MRYFPLHHDRFEHDFGIRALGPNESILERTEHYAAEVALKRRLLSEDPPNYFGWLSDSRLACEEAARWLQQLIQGLPLPQENRDEARVALPDAPPLDVSLLDDAAIAAGALRDVALCVQEDLVILSPHADDGHRVLAGVVCFPSGWTIKDKLGHSMLATHAPVPEFASRLADPTTRLLERLKPHRPVWRMNWGIRCSDQLDQSPKRAAGLQEELTALTPQTIAQRCHFRVERQTLSRLPITRAILFTIHTHQCPLRELDESQRQRLLGVLRTCPEATLRYKGILPMRGMLEQYLVESLSNSDPPTNPSANSLR